MRRAGLAGRAARRWKKTTIADPAAATRADRIRRDFTADASKLNSRWCGDITYVRTWEGWLFLATVIDIASRRVAGYAMADHLRTSLVTDALGNAAAARDPAPGVIFHSALRPGVGVMDQPGQITSTVSPLGPQRLLQRIQHQGVFIDRAARQPRIRRE